MSLIILAQCHIICVYMTQYFPQWAVNLHYPHVW